MKKRFKIACSWEVCGELKIEADSFEEAWKKAKEKEDELPLPEGEYIDGSFKLDKYMSQHLNS